MDTQQVEVSPDVKTLTMTVSRMAKAYLTSWSSIANGVDSASQLRKNELRSGIGTRITPKTPMCGPSIRPSQR
jgi:hypothetical protein